MRHKIFILLVMILGYAGTISAQKVTLNFQKTKLEKVFSSITEQTGYTFAYSQPTVNVDKAVSISVSNIELSAALKQLFQGSEISYEINDKKIFLTNIQTNTTPEKQTVAGKAKNVSGVITDQSGEPIIGATVSVKGTTKGTITDIDGKFMLEADSNSSLSVTYMGYLTQDIKVGNKSTFDIKLQEDNKLLDEVVVVGYGIQKKRDVTTSIASIRSKDMEGQPVTSMAEAMVGKMPGVQVSQGSGAPGQGLQIKVRGTGTITAGTSPLYVVDGVPLAEEQLNTFNMNDVESIEVLKDASSAAIYGSRGANGVILITTKKGVEGRPVVSYNGYYGWQTVSKKIDMLNAYEYADLVKDARNNSYSDAMASINKKRIVQGQNPLSWSLNDNNAMRLQNSGTNYSTIIPVELIPYLEGKTGLTDTDWQDEIFRTAGIQNHSVSVAGGTAKTKYYTSFDFLNQDGIILNSDFRRYGARLNLDITEGIFKFGVNFNPSITIENKINSDGVFNKGGIVASALHSSPIFSVYNPDGSYNFAQNAWSPDTETQMPDGSVKRGNSQTNVWNPVALAMLQKDRTKSTRMLGNMYAQVDILKGLNYKANFGFDIFDSSRDQFKPSTIPVANTMGNPESEAEGQSNTSKLYNWLFEQTINFNRDFNGHSFNGIAGWTMQYEREESTYAFANGYISNQIPTLNAGTVVNGNSRASEWTLLSGLARVQYSYKSKYMASGAIRTDGASRFGKNNRWGWFPSLSLGWRMTEEGFMKSLTFIDDLKLRASYGLTGNFRIPNYGALGEMKYYSYVLGGSNPTVNKGVAPYAMSNPDLKWEKTSQVNVGFDATLFKNKLTLGLDLYNSDTYDLLLDVPIPLSTGYKTRLENIGKVNNRGIEFNISTNHQFGDFKWNAYFNISKNINEVKKLGPGNTDIIVSGTVSNAYFITRVGESIGSYYLPVVEGVFQNQAEVDEYLHYIDAPSNYDLNTTQPGDFRFKDVNGDGKLDILDTDRAIVGNYMPDFTYGFGTGLQWKGIDFAISFQGVQGNEILNLSRRYFFNMEGNMNNYKGALNRWKSDADSGDGKTVRANRVSKGQNGVTSTWHVEDGSYLRIKNITLGYSLPKHIIQKAYLQNARIYLSAQNPFTFTKYKGYNPEVSNRTESTRSGEDYGVYPLARTISVGANLTF